MEPHRKNVVLATCCSAVAFLSLCGIGAGVYDVRRAQAAEAWPAVDGVVIESSHVLGCGKRGIAFFPTVRYEYRVGGIARRGGRITFGDERCATEATVKDIAGRYPVGAVVKVSFDPQAPNEAVLVTGKVPENTWTGIAFLSFFFLISAGLASLFVAMSRSSLRARQAAEKEAPPPARGAPK